MSKELHKIKNNYNSCRQFRENSNKIYHFKHFWEETFNLCTSCHSITSNTL